MIDIHAHILPNVDDGSKSLEETLLMLREEEKSGVSDVICTPHLHAKYRADSEYLNDVFTTVKAAAERQCIGVNLHLGREVFISKHYKMNIKKFSAVMPDGKHVLAEYDCDHERDIAETVYELVSEGYTPIIAHIERYSYLNMFDVEEIKGLGARIQVNAESVVASVFSRSGRCAKKLLSSGLVDFVASDVHYGRKNYLKKAYGVVSTQYGDAYADEIFNENAKKIIKG